MKKINSKSLMVLAIIVASAFAMPSMVSSYETNDTIELNQFGDVDPSELVRNFGGFGNIFSNNLGPTGALLGEIFLLLLNQTLELEEQEVSQGIFVLNASVRKNPDPFLGSVSRDGGILYLPESYQKREDGYYYCTTDYSGQVTVDLVVGGFITLIIWDHDKSFINALLRVINAIKTFLTATSDNINSALKTAISAIVWFLIHINDIFTGDELLILNPMTYQKLTLTADTVLNFKKIWRFRNFTTQSDQIVGEDVLKTWNTTAKLNDDAYMEWLLTNITISIGRSITWTQFSFDIFQFWMKNFQININVADLLSGNADIANAFSGCDIEFYLFTHHLAGTYLYKDNDTNNKVSVNYTEYNDNGETIEIPKTNELTHMLHLQDGNYQFQDPEIDDGNVTWGLEIFNPTVAPVPLGADTETYFDDSNSRNLGYIKFGLTFIPSVSGSLAQGRIKLVHEFDKFDTDLNNDLDMSILYISSILHFHLSVTNQAENPEEPLALLQENDYFEEEESLRIGNYLSTSGQELEFVDIAREDYSYGENPGDNWDDAQSSIIPVALYEMEVNAHRSYDVGSTEEYDPYAADVNLTLSYNVLGYAVSYPQFNGGTNGIWHDPTFNVFMVFEPTAFWALILLVGGVSILGVATVLIKRKKDGKTPF